MTLKILVTLPAKAGIHSAVAWTAELWAPACAGVEWAYG